MFWLWRTVSVVESTGLCRLSRTFYVAQRKVGSFTPTFLIHKQLPSALLNADTSFSLCHNFIHTSNLLLKKKAKKEKHKHSKKDQSEEDEELDPQDLPQSVDELVDLNELRSSFTSTFNDLKQEFTSRLALRTNQASFNNFQLQLDDGKLVTLQYLAQISMKSPHQVHINLASNPHYLPKVRDALQNSAFNVNPRIEGTSIFIDTPRVTREHREKLSKSAKKLGDAHKEKIRVQQNASWKLAEVATNMFSKDDIRRVQKEILQLGKTFNKQIDDAVKHKQKELLSDD